MISKQDAEEFSQTLEQIGEAGFANSRLESNSARRKRSALRGANGRTESA